MIAAEPKSKWTYIISQTCGSYEIQMPLWAVFNGIRILSQQQ